MVIYSLKSWDGKWISDPHLQIPSTIEYARSGCQMNITDRLLTEQDLFDTSFYDRASISIA